MLKIDMLVKNCNLGPKLKFGSKIDSLVKKCKFRQKSKLSSKIDILIKNWNSKIFGKIENFNQKSIVKIFSIFEILDSPIQIIWKIYEIFLAVWEVDQEGLKTICGCANAKIVCEEPNQEIMVQKRTRCSLRFEF